MTIDFEKLRKKLAINQYYDLYDIVNGILKRNINTYDEWLTITIGIENSTEQSDEDKVRICTEYLQLQQIISTVSEIERSPETQLSGLKYNREIKEEHDYIFDQLLKWQIITFQDYYDQLLPGPPELEGGNIEEWIKKTTRYITLLSYKGVVDYYFSWPCEV